ncbi:D-alanyl-D-alanine carboxypeptidase precursor [compost metagenome]
MAHTLNRRSFLAHTAAFAAAGLVPASSALGAAQSPKLTPMIAAERDSIRAAMRGSRIGAAAVCFVQNGEPQWVEGFGHTSEAEAHAVNDSTLFSIQSTTKSFTTVAVLLSVQDGLLDLDAPITRYLPDFTVRSRFEAAPEKRITLRLLLANRAGFTHEAPVGNNYEAASPGFEAHVRSIAATWLRFPVGERYRYSNLGFDLAGHILEQSTGTGYAQWLQRKLFTPLDMHDSTADPAVYMARSNRAVGSQDGFAEVPSVTPLVASGGVWTSARDMAKYLSFMLARGRGKRQPLLAPELWNEMHGFGLGGDYGLGVMRTERRYGSTPVRLLHHRGGGFGFGCVFTYCPEAELGFAAMFNRATSAGYGFGDALTDHLLAARFGPRAPRLPASAMAPIRPNPDRAHAFAGSWIGRNVHVDIRRTDDGQLRLHRKDTGTDVPFELVDTDVMFTVDAEGEVVTYRYHAPVADLPAHLECASGEESLDHNDSPAMPAGPEKPQWDRWLGRYRIDQWGKPAMVVEIERRAGWLYLDGTRLVVETEPGLFFTSDGEAVDFRGSTPTWRNLLLHRIQPGG